MAPKKSLQAIALLSLILLAAPCRADKQERDTVVFTVDIHCDGCVQKIEKNIAFEKGLKDMKINKQEQTVTLVYDKKKTTIEKLKQAFEKIKKPVRNISRASKN